MIKDLQKAAHIAAALSSWAATSNNAPALSLRGTCRALPSRRAGAGRRCGWCRSEPRPSGRKRGTIRSVSRAKLEVSCLRVGSSWLLPTQTKSLYRRGAIQLHQAAVSARPSAEFRCSSSLSDALSKQILIARLVGPDCLHDRNYLYPFVSSAASDAHGCRRFFLPV